MSITRMTTTVKSSLEGRLADLDQRIETVVSQREGGDTLEASALLEQLRRERSDVADALRDAIVIDGEPFDTEAIEIGDTITIRNDQGDTERYVLIDGKVRSRARDDWVSLSSPLGSALLARNKGDRVEVQSPSGTTSYVIVDFERASDHPIVLAPFEQRERAGGRRLLPSEAFIC